MDENMLKELEGSFKLKAREGVGGKIFKYVPSEDIVNRMNKVFKGNWSTEVRSSEVVEDNILVCVRVQVTDADHNRYYHDGYASHPLARYSGGANEGRIIDVGNSYRSAVSKAIKTACTRWGVALYLEEGEEGSSSSKTTSPSVEIPTVTQKTPIEPSIVPGIPVSASPAGVSVSPPMNINNPIDTNKPVFTNGNVVPLETTVGNVPFNVQSAQGVSNEAVENSVEKESLLTSVQKVAIETIMSTHNIKFEDLAAQALVGEVNLPLKLEEVKYLDAVTIIQHGNHLTKPF